MAVPSVSLVMASVISLLYFSGVLPRKGIPIPGLGDAKTAHIEVYWHDVVAGENPTAVPVAAGPNTNESPTEFGKVVVLDDLLTEGPELNSTHLGRAQGIYVFAGIHETSLLMAMTFVFTAGEYKGSTLVLMGHNPIMEEAREMAVTGGTGVFRGARGYAQPGTHFFDVESGDAIVHYDINVLHH